MISCRPGCAACCIAPSISSPIPGMPLGKPAGVRCIQLTTDNLCLLFGKTERPSVCSSFQPDPEMCAGGSHKALTYLALLESHTQPPEA